MQQLLQSNNDKDKGKAKCGKNTAPDLAVVLPYV